MPLRRFAEAGLSLPSGHILTADDRLRLSVVNSVAGRTVTFAAKLIMPDGRLVRIQETITPASDRTSSNLDINPGAGVLISVAVSATPSPVRRGETYCLLFTYKGTVGTLIADFVLFADYVVSGHALGWPPGRIVGPTEGPGVIRSITGTDPAAGAEISETVPSNARWRLLGVVLSLVSSAVAGNRRPHVFIDDGTNIVARAISSQTQAASATLEYDFTIISTAQTGSLSTHQPLPDLGFLPGGYRIRTETDNSDGSDNYGAPQLLVEEWIED